MNFYFKNTRPTFIKLLTVVAITLSLLGSKFSKSFLKPSLVAFASASAASSERLSKSSSLVSATLVLAFWVLSGCSAVLKDKRFSPVGTPTKSCGVAVFILKSEAQIFTSNLVRLAFRPFHWFRSSVGSRRRQGGDNAGWTPRG